MTICFLSLGTIVYCRFGAVALQELPPVVWRVGGEQDAELVRAEPARPGRSTLP